MLHALESRRLLAAAIVNPGASGVLNVEGTGGNDSIVLSVSGGQVHVRINGVVQHFATDFSDGEFHRIVINGGNGHDTIAGSDLDEAVYGGAGNDVLEGNGGADRVVGGIGNDNLSGGLGNDTLIGAGGADVIRGGRGQDRADYYYDSRSMRLSIDGIANDGVGRERDNILTDIEEVYGGQGHDFISGSSGRNVLHGRGGNDTLSGAGGADSLFGDEGRDSLLGGQDNDLLDGGLNGDTLRGGTGHDHNEYFKGFGASYLFIVIRSGENIIQDSVVGESDVIFFDVADHRRT